MALRYIERNPSRAKLLLHAADYPWSSASARLGGVDETGLLELISWQHEMPIAVWQDRLLLPEEDAAVLPLRLATQTGHPLGRKSFLAECEMLLGRQIIP